MSFDVSLTGSLDATSKQLQEEVSYIIFIENGITYAKNGSTGRIDHRGTDAAKVIQATLNALPLTPDSETIRSGQLHFKLGKYVINTDLTFPANTRRVIITGEGTDTELSFTKVSAGKLFDITLGTATTEIVFRDIKLKGNNVATTYGIYGDFTAFGHASLIELENVIISNFDIGLSNTYGSNMILITCHFENNITWDLYLTTAMVTIIGGLIINIHSIGSMLTVIGLGTAYVYLHSGENQPVSFYGTWFDPTTQEENIMIGGGGGTKNILLDSCHFMGGATYHIRIGVGVTSYVTIRNPTFYTPTPDLTYYVYAGGATVTASVLIENAVNLPYAKIGGNIDAFSLEGLGYKSSGTATITAAATSIVVPHGCSYTPSALDVSVILTNLPTNDIGDIYVDTFGAINFTIHCRNVPGAATAIFNWAVRRTP